jgi:septum formation protein
LLGDLLGTERIEVVTPRLASEPGFDGLETLADVDQQLAHVARLKHDDVCEQTAARRPLPCVVAADTVIVGLHANDSPVVLGKPPEDDAARRSVVRKWFTEFYAGRRHLAKTGLCVGFPAGPRFEAIVTTEVWFRADAVEFIDWYLATDEPRGKAGGYAIQEAGSLFVERLDGSLSNVVGLPLVEALQLLRQAGAAR